MKDLKSFACRIPYSQKKVEKRNHEFRTSLTDFHKFSTQEKSRTLWPLTEIQSQNDKFELYTPVCGSGLQHTETQLEKEQGPFFINDI